jgi:DNA replication and repair protein RecF
MNFRNYKGLFLEFNEKINLIIGKNGQGKTNLVESIYMLSIGKSFRTNKDKELIKFGENNLYIDARIYRDDETKEIEVLIDNKNKGIKVNKISIIKISELLGNFNVVVFSPEDLKLVKDGPKERRSFIDKEISQLIPKYYNNLQRYRKTLFQRNKLLKNFSIDINLLEVYDEELAKYGSYIYITRRDFVKKLSDISKKFHKELTGNKEELSLIYKTQIDLNDSDDYNSVYQKLKSKLFESREHDIYNKITRYGIHKDDIEIYIDDIDVRLYGSQGQQRTASISLKLSEIELIKNEVGEYPVLILDDVFSELDEYRQKLLVEKLNDIQIFITTADISHKAIFRDVEATVFNVKEGMIDKIENGGR